MKTPIVIVATVALLLTILGTALLRADGQTSTPGITQQWVDQHLVSWKPPTVTPMSFSVLWGRASYNGLYKSFDTLAVENASLKSLQATGVGYIRMDIDYGPWLSNKTSYQSEVTTLVNQVKADGKLLIIADAGATRYQSNPIPWTQFQSAWIQRVKTLAALYHPAYYIVIKEPGWYVPMVSDAYTNPSFSDPNTWISLTQQLASAVLSVSPNTKVGVSVAADDLNKQPAFYQMFLPGAEALSGVSFSGYDIYTAGGYNGTQGFLSQFGNGGKSVWIAECWSGTASIAFDSSRATLDAGWITAAYYFAQQIHASMMIPFFTSLFNTYLPGDATTNQSQILAQLQQHTPVFYSYQGIISSNAAGTYPPLPTTSTASTGTITSIGTIASTSTPVLGSNPPTTSTTSSVGSGQGGSNDFVLVAAAAGVVVVAVAVVAVAFSRRGRWPSIRRSKDSEQGPGSPAVA